MVLTHGLLSLVPLSATASISTVNHHRVSPERNVYVILGTSFTVDLSLYWCIVLKKNQSAPRPPEHPPVMGEKNVKTFRWDQRLQIQNLFMAFKQFGVPAWRLIIM